MIWHCDDCELNMLILLAYGFAFLFELLKIWGCELLKLKGLNSWTLSSWTLSFWNLGPWKFWGVEPLRGFQFKWGACFNAWGAYIYIYIYIYIPIYIYIHIYTCLSSSVDPRLSHFMSESTNEFCVARQRWRLAPRLSTVTSARTSEAVVGIRQNPSETVGNRRQKPSETVGNRRKP